jgi:phage shock protein PspC (stress-responsive transcriptional regulator)
MNKVFNINLGGQPLTIDEDAYRLLENYLQSLHNHFRASEGYEEIMSDIEARLGELLREGMGKRAIVMIQDVKNTVSIMGKPEEFGAEPMDETEKTSEKASETTSNAQNTEGASNSGNAQNTGKKPPIQTGKRLFRDEDNKVIGGVCSGLAAYFGVQEVVWVRLTVFFLGMFTGLGFFLYLVLWIIIPKAKTTADRLAMRGEPIDVNSIAKSIETGFDDLSKKVNEFGGSTEAQKRFGHQVSAFTTSVGEGIGNVLRGFGGVAKVIAAIISIIIIASIVISWVAAAVGLAWASPVVGYLTDEPWQGTLSVLVGFILVAVPTLELIFLVRRLLFNRGTHVAVHLIIWTIWTINCGGIAYLAGNFGKNFTHQADKMQSYNMVNTIDTFNIAVARNPDNHINFQLGDLHVSEDYLISENVSLFIKPSETGAYELTQQTQSQGRTDDEAKMLLSRINFTPSVTESKLTVPAEFMIPKGLKWRGQVIDMTLKIPVGKVFRIKEADIDSWNVVHIDHKSGRGRSDCYGARVQTWRMTEKGAECINEPRKKSKKGKRGAEEPTDEDNNEDEE